MRKDQGSMLTAKFLCRYLGLIIMTIVSHIAMGQQSQAIHLLSETGQTFSVQLNGTGYSSTKDGYLVIPGVPGGDHLLVVGFNGWMPEYAFTCRVTDKPLAFSLKLAVDNSWSLFDMVDFTVTKGSIATAAQSALARTDPSAPPIGQVRNTDSAGQAETSPAVPRIQKIFDKASPGGVDQVYIIVNGTKADTVALFIHALEEPEAKHAANKPIPESRKFWSREAMLVSVPGIPRQNR